MFTTPFSTTNPWKVIIILENRPLQNFPIPMPGHSVSMLVWPFTIHLLGLACLHSFSLCVIGCPQYMSAYVKHLFVTHCGFFLVPFLPVHRVAKWAYYTRTMNCFAGPFFGVVLKNKLQKSLMSFNFHDSKIPVFVPFFSLLVYSENRNLFWIVSWAHWRKLG